MKVEDPVPSTLLSHHTKGRTIQMDTVLRQVSRPCSNQSSETGKNDTDISSCLQGDRFLDLSGYPRLQIKPWL